MLGNEIRKGLQLLKGATVEVGDCRRREDGSWQKLILSSG